MEILFAVLLLVTLLLPGELLSSASAPQWLPGRLRNLRLVSDRAAEPAADGLDGTVEAGAQSRLFDGALLQRRLDALTEELDRLDRSPEVFARAFHTSVARSAYDALVAQATALPAEPCSHVGSTIEVELLEP